MNDALKEARNSLTSFQRDFTDEGKVYALDAIASALIAIAEEMRVKNEWAGRDNVEEPLPAWVTEDEEAADPLDDELLY